MQRSLLALVACALLVGCSAPRLVQLAAPCPKMNRQEVITVLTGLVAGEGMTVTLVNENVGILQASGSPHKSWGDLVEQKQWQFSVRGDTVYGFAKTVYTTAERVEGEMPVTDDASSDERWYWNVRNGLQKVCGGGSLLFIPQ